MRSPIKKSISHLTSPTNFSVSRFGESNLWHWSYDRNWGLQSVMQLRPLVYFHRLNMNKLWLDRLRRPVGSNDTLYALILIWVIVINTNITNKCENRCNSALLLASFVVAYRTSHKSINAGRAQRGREHKRGSVYYCMARNPCQCNDRSAYVFFWTSMKARFWNPTSSCLSLE